MTFSFEGWFVSGSLFSKIVDQTSLSEMVLLSPLLEDLLEEHPNNLIMLGPTYVFVASSLLDFLSSSLLT